MKKFWIVLLLGLFYSEVAHAAYQEFYPKPDKENPFQVIGRGVGNLAGLPAEAGTTMVREYRMHPHAWPATYLFRLGTNVVYRITSGVTDMIFLPVATPIIRETTPLTTNMGLPKYPWNVD